MDKLPPALLLTLFLLPGTLIADQSEPAFGSVESPVKTQGLDGARTYIQNLDCENGAIPEYKHEASTEAGPAGNKLEKYVLRCSADEVEMYTIYLDPNHQETDTKPVKGFISWL